MYGITHLEIIYRSRTNRIVRDKSCEYCSRHGQHVSCDARAWLSVRRLPLIPLRMHHLTDECANCGRVRTMPLNEWKQMTARVLAEAIQIYKNNPSHPKTVRNVIRTAMEHPLPDLLQELGKRIEAEWRNDPNTLFLLFQAYDFLGMKDDADRIFRQVDKFEAARAVCTNPVDRPAT